MEEMLRHHITLEINGWQLRQIVKLIDMMQLAEQKLQPNKKPKHQEIHDIVRQIDKLIDDCKIYE